MWSEAALGQDKNGNVLDGPEKFDDHLLDTLRYAVYTHSRKKAPDIRII